MTTIALLIFCHLWSLTSEQEKKIQNFKKLFEGVKNRFTLCILKRNCTVFSQLWYLTPSKPVEKETVVLEDFKLWIIMTYWGHLLYIKIVVATHWLKNTAQDVEGFVTWGSNGWTSKAYKNVLGFLEIFWQNRNEAFFGWFKYLHSSLNLRFFLSEHFMTRLCI